MKRLLATHIIFIVYLTLSLFADEVLKKVKLATVEWPPFTVKNSADQGLSTKIVKEIFKTQGVEVEVYFMPWSRVMKSVKEGEYDAAYPAYYAEERKKFYDFSESFYASPVHLTTTVDSNIKSTILEELKNYKIGIVNGYVNSPEFDKADFLNKKKANSDKKNMVKLFGKRLDMIVIDKNCGEYLLKEESRFKNKKLRYLEPALDKKDLYLLVSKKISYNQAILNCFSKGIKALKEKGAFEKLLR